jgi:hypothetical protein
VPWMHERSNEGVKWLEELYAILPKASRLDARDRESW